MIDFFVIGVKVFVCEFGSIEGIFGIIIKGLVGEVMIDKGVIVVVCYIYFYIFDVVKWGIEDK